jgi:prepilin-type N-terminal cleavage/methylation domain-containing protein
MKSPLFQPKGGFNLCSREYDGSSRAFTLTELLVVLATLALLAVLALPALGNAKVSSRQLSCLENLRQLGIASHMYVVEYQQYTGSLSTPEDGSPNYAYVWPKRLLNYTGGNRNVFACPAAIPISRWDTNLNASLGGTYQGVYDPYTITITSRFSYGINDWGIHFQNGAERVTIPQLGLGGDIGGSFYLGPVRDSDVVAPSQMIMLGDSSPTPPSVTPNFCANIEPAVTSQPHTSCPSNRHNYQTDLVFTDGHVETPLRNDVRNPNSSYWRARWNNDNNPHLAYGYWQSNPPWVNMLDPSY